MSISPDELFRITKDDINCNTSYPIAKSVFTKYQDGRFDLTENVHDLSFYIHIPFCKSLCRFCEYTRVRSGNENQELYYAGRLSEQVAKWIDSHEIQEIYGFDIGGGTPVSITDKAFLRILDLKKKILEFGKPVKDFESSIEFSYPVVTDEKIKMICEAGFERVSAGLQLVDDVFLSDMNRENSGLRRMLDVNRKFKEGGVKKINVDVMYGFENQTEKSFDDTVTVLRELSPEQVTLYEMRFNNTSLAHDRVTRDGNFRLYSHLYGKLLELGYCSEFGSNTFTKDRRDFGVSSYLRYRMLEGIPYKGFGISAQSMSDTGLSYCSFKNFGGNSFPDDYDISETDVYRLPSDEIAAKYVAIAFYNGKFSLKPLRRILGTDPAEYYRSEFEFLTDAGYVTLDNDICKATRKGFMYYGAIVSLFWSDSHKDFYMRSNNGGSLKCN